MKIANGASLLAMAIGIGTNFAYMGHIREVTHSKKSV